MAIQLDQTLAPTKVAAPQQFDIDHIGPIRESFEDLLMDKGQLVVVDLSLTEFIDSSGIGAIIYLFKRLKSQQRVLQLYGVHGQPRRILTMLRVDRAIPFVGDGVAA